MKSVFRKPYDELFAKYCIEQYFPHLGLDFRLVNDDPPDLADDDTNTSVEVTRAGDERDFQRASAFTQYRDKDKSEIPSRLLEKIKTGFEGSIFNEGKLVGMALSGGSDLYEHIRNSYIKKLKRLNEVPEKFLPNKCLFVYADTFIFREGLRLLLEEMDAEGNNRGIGFDKIVILCQPYICLCDITSRGIDMKEISFEEVERLKQKTLQTLERLTS